jgi:hypothetical protein
MFFAINLIISVVGNIQWKLILRSALAVCPDLEKKVGEAWYQKEAQKGVFAIVK